MPVLRTPPVRCEVHSGVERVHRFIEDVKEPLREVEIRTLAGDIVGLAIVGDVVGDVVVVFQS